MQKIFFVFYKKGEEAIVKDKSCNCRKFILYEEHNQIYVDTNGL